MKNDSTAWPAMPMSDTDQDQEFIQIHGIDRNGQKTSLVRNNDRVS